MLLEELLLIFWRISLLAWGKLGISNRVMFGPMVNRPNTIFFENYVSPGSWAQCDLTGCTGAGLVSIAYIRKKFQHKLDYFHGGF